MKQILTFSAYDYYVDSFEKSTKQLNDLYRLQENLPSLNEIDALAERRLPNYPLFLVWVLALIETSQNQSEQSQDMAKQIRKRINGSFVLIDDEDLPAQ